MPAKDVHLELRPQHLGRQVLNRTRLAIRPVVKQCEQTPSGRVQDMCRGIFNGLGLGIVKIKALHADFIAQPRDVVRLARRGKNPPSARLHHPGRAETDA